MSLKVLLDNVGNPDRQQDPTRQLPGVARRWKKVEDFAAASKACRDYIALNDLGGGNWSGGEIVDASNRPVGRVSYNGRVWPPGPDVVGQKPLWPKEEARKPVDPYAFEKTRLEVPGYGVVEVGGCYRIASLESVPGKFEVGGRRHDFMTHMEMTPEGLRSIRPFSLMVDGSYDRSAACPREVLAAVTKVVKSWAGTEEGKLLVLGNEVRDRRHTMDHAAGQVAYREADLAKARDTLDDARRQFEEFEALLAERGAGGPTP